MHFPLAYCFRKHSQPVVGNVRVNKLANFTDADLPEVCRGGGILFL